MDTNFMTSREILNLFALDHEVQNHSLLGVEDTRSRGLLITCSCGEKIAVSAASVAVHPAIPARLRKLGKYDILKHQIEKGGK